MNVVLFLFSSKQHCYITWCIIKQIFVSACIEILWGTSQKVCQRHLIDGPFQSNTNAFSLWWILMIMTLMLELSQRWFKVKVIMVQDVSSKYSWEFLTTARTSTCNLNTTPDVTSFLASYDLVNGQWLVNKVFVLNYF